MTSAHFSTQSKKEKKKKKKGSRQLSSIILISTLLYFSWSFHLPSLILSLSSIFIRIKKCTYSLYMYVKIISREKKSENQKKESFGRQSGSSNKTIERRTRERIWGTFWFYSRCTHTLLLLLLLNVQIVASRAASRSFILSQQQQITIFSSSFFLLLLL